MIYLLDSNVWIALMRGKPSQVQSRYNATDADLIRTCSIVVAELRTGAEKSADSVANHNLIDDTLRDVGSLFFDDDAARMYGRIRSHLESVGNPIGPLDTLIAAIALANDCTLVTHDVGEFSRVPGLTVVDWQAP